MNKDERDIMLQRARVYLDALPETSRIAGPKDMYALNHRLNYLADAIHALLDVVEALSEEVESLAEGNQQ